MAVILLASTTGLLGLAGLWRRLRRRRISPVAPARGSRGMSRPAMAGHPLRQRLARWALGIYVLVIGLFLLAPILAITAGSLTTTSYVSSRRRADPQMVSADLRTARLPERAGLSLGVACRSDRSHPARALVALALHRYPRGSTS